MYARHCAFKYERYDIAILFGYVTFQIDHKKKTFRFNFIPLVNYRRRRSRDVASGKCRFSRRLVPAYTSDENVFAIE